MKLKKAKVPKIKITHNKKLFLILLILIILLIVLVFFILKNQKIKKECVKDIDCVPKSCCHSNSCVPEKMKPDCNGILCSAVCSGPLDCGAGKCGCVNGRCEVIPNERKNP